MPKMPNDRPPELNTVYDTRLNKETVTNTVEKVLPEFARDCRRPARVIFLTQESFATDFNVDDCMLLGMAVKYAGIHGKEVRIRLQPLLIN